MWAAFITAVGEDSGTDPEHYGENIREKEIEMSTQDQKLEERKRPILSLFSGRKNVVEREQSVSRIFRSVTEEATTKHTLETHITEVPLTEDRQSFLLKFFQKIQAKFELETV